MAQIGIKIKQRREELNMTQEELAKKLGYKSKSTINKIEAGINDIVQSKVFAFAEALETTPAHLMGWDEEPASTLDVVENIPQLITEKEQQLITNFQRLNPAGQSKAIDYVSDLADNPKYQLIKETEAYYIPEVLAAHHDGELNEEDKQHINAAIQYVGKQKREKGEL